MTVGMRAASTTSSPRKVESERKRERERERERERVNSKLLENVSGLTRE